MYYKYINNHLFLMDFGSAELFQTANIPTEHFLRTQLSLKLHLSFNHKNMTICVSPILPYITLRLILHSAPCCVKLESMQGCASELPLKSPPD